MSQPRPEELFEILVREHARGLDVFLRGALRDRSLADDLFQETLIVAWRRLGDFDRKRPFGPWLRGIAANLVMKSHRRRAVVVDDDTVLDALERRCAALHDAPGDTLDERLALLDECLRGLPDRMRRAVELKYGHGEGSEVLAERLETSAVNARKILQRARERLGDCVLRRLDALAVTRGEST